MKANDDGRPADTTSEELISRSDAKRLLGKLHIEGALSKAKAKLSDVGETDSTSRPLQQGDVQPERKWQRIAARHHGM